MHEIVRLIQLFMHVLCDHETVAQRVSRNLATFYYHCKIYRFECPCFATSMYWIKGFFRPVICLLLLVVLPRLELIRFNNVVVKEILNKTSEFAKS